MRYYQLRFCSYVVNVFFFSLLSACVVTPSQNKTNIDLETKNSAEKGEVIAQCKEAMLMLSANTGEPSPEKVLALSKEIDRLNALIAKEEKALNHSNAGTRLRRYFVGARAKDADVALYKANWEKKIEKFGNDHYPEVAKKNHFYGKVQLSTSIMADGTVEKVEINKSSGCEILDKHAEYIVKAAAPYPPFGQSMKDKFDILSITRTFSYLNESY